MKHRSLNRIAGMAIAWLTLFACIGLSLFAYSSHVRAVPVLTGSMTPAYPVGSLAVTAQVPTHAIKVGDVIAFIPPSPYTTPNGSPVMHRVVSLENKDGAVIIRTKGDHNPEMDPWTLRFTSPVMQKTTMVIPMVGHVTAAIKSPKKATSGLAIGGIVFVALAVLLWPSRKTCDVCALRDGHIAMPMTNSTLWEYSEDELTQAIEWGMSVYENDGLAALFADERQRELIALELDEITEMDALAWITDLAKETTGSAYSYLTIVNDVNTYTLSCTAAQQTFSPATNGEYLQSTCVHVAAAGQAVMFNDMQANGLSEKMSFTAEKGIQSYLGVPVYGRNGVVLGSLCVANRTSHTWSEEDLEVMERLARAASKEILLAANIIDLSPDLTAA